jgi:hypothetical protein
MRVIMYPAGSQVYFPAHLLGTKMVVVHRTPNGDFAPPFVHINAHYRQLFCPHLRKPLRIRELF